MPVSPSEIKSLAGQLLQDIAKLHPDRNMVSVSDVRASNRVALAVLDFLHSNGYVLGRSQRSNGNDEGIVAITDVRMTQRGRNWLATLSAQQH